jgi:nicotinamidase-related amidase
MRRNSRKSRRGRKKPNYSAASRRIRRRNSHRRRRSGGGKSAMRGGGLEKSFTNPNEFCTYYQLQYAANINVLDNPNFIMTAGYDTIPEGSVLWVIDMQNDFIDEPVSDEELSKEGVAPLRLSTPSGHIGNFTVNGGIACVKGINDLIDQYKSKFSRIVYTRDFHSPGHCSFQINGKFDLDGKYPGHCEYNSLGAAFNNKIHDQIKRNEDGTYFIQGATIPGSMLQSNNIPVDIIFKGYHFDADSYTGVDGPTENTRQNQNNGMGFINHSCCQGDNCNGKMGGSILKDQTIDARGRVIFKEEDATINKLIDMFAPPPPGESKSEEEKAEIHKSIGEDSKLSTKIAEKYFDEYTLPEPTGQGKIYVVGLAGDFCVKDTAINLKYKFNDKDVVVIQDLTRYVFTPFMLPFQRYELTHPDDNQKSKYGELLPFGDWITKDGKEVDAEVFVKDKGTKKSLSKYLFSFDGKNYQKKTVEEIGKLKSSDITNMENHNLHNFWHFASDIRPLIKDYYSSGVKLMVNPKSQGYKDIMERIRQEKTSDEN